MALFAEHANGKAPNTPLNTTVKQDVYAFPRNGYYTK
jgi:hypothetical protein